MEVVMADLFWLSDAQWAVIEPFMPRNQPGPEREDDRRIISGILDVLTSGCRWRDCPSEYGARTTVCNRFNQCSRRGFWNRRLKDFRRIATHCDKLTGNYASAVALASSSPSGADQTQRLGWIGKVAYGVVSRLSAFGAGVAQSAAAKCAIWSACAFTKAGRAVARAT
jgi:transposase